MELDLTNKYHKQLLEIRMQIVKATSIDEWHKVSNMRWAYSPEHLLERAVNINLLKIDEITKEVWEAAMSKAEDINDDYLDSGHGIGSSDTNYFVSSILNAAGIKVEVVGNKFERVL